MNITPIQGREVSSRGYLHKSVYRYVDRATENTKIDISGLKSKVSKEQYAHTVDKINETRNSIIANLEKFISACHPATYLEIEDKFCMYPMLCLNNKKLNLHYGIPGMSILMLDKDKSSTEMIKPLLERPLSVTNGDYFSKLGDSDLKQLKRYSDELVKVPAKLADNAILRNFTVQTEEHNVSAFTKLSYKSNCNKINKFKEEIGSKAV